MTLSKAIRTSLRRPRLPLLAFGAACLMVVATLLPAAPAEAAWPYAQMWNYHSGKCMDVPGGSTANGTQLIIWPCNGAANQHFVRIAVSKADAGSSFTTFFMIKNEHSQKCLSVKGDSTTPGTPIIQWPCNSKDHAEQFWFSGNYSPDPSRYWSLISWGAAIKGGDLEIHPAAAMTAAGTHITASKGTDHSYFWTLPPMVSS